MTDEYSSDTHSIADGLNRAKNAILNKQDKIPATVVAKKDLRPLSKRKVKILDKKAETARKSGDFFTGSRFGDDKGRSYSVKDAIKTAKRKGQSVSLPTGGFVGDQVNKYWQGNMERTKKADYSKPVLVVRNEDAGVGAPTNNTGGVAGIGVGPKGEPGVHPRHQPKKNKSTPTNVVLGYLRRKVPQMEEETLDELSKDTLRNYIKKASDSRATNQGGAKFYQDKGITPRNQKKYGKAIRNVINRRTGIRRAVDKLEEETFAGAAVFEVSSKIFHNVTMQKRKGKHWRTYLEEDDCYAEIREWAKKNRKGKIIVRNENTGEMRYVRY